MLTVRRQFPAISLPGRTGMAYCRRVPAFPLTDGDALLKETAQRLGTEQPLSPEAVDGLFCTMSTIRRHIHANPEPGYEEVKTHAFLKKVLQEFAGIDASHMRSCAKTGLVVDIRGKGPPSSSSRGPETIQTIALRADMDALRMTELNNGLPYRSGNEGVAHLCGHDGHMASLIGGATLIAKRADRLPSNCMVRLLFQPAEEGPGGAEPMIQEHCLDGVDECCACAHTQAHTRPHLCPRAHETHAHKGARTHPACLHVRSRRRLPQLACL